jgi:hypothetical protein
MSYLAAVIAPSLWRSVIAVGKPQTSDSNVQVDEVAYGGLVCVSGLIR